MNYSLISKFRNQLFGLSILNIILFHYAEDVLAAKAGIPAFVVTLCSLYMKVLASVGVEIFLFLSGMGLYYAMQKKPALGEFYRKRMTRLLIPYAIVGGVFWLVVDVIISGGGALDWLYDFTFLSFWIEGNRAIWYIGLLALLYLLFPAIYRFCEHEGSRTVRVAGLTAGSMVTILVLAFLFPEYISNTEVALGRVAVFLAGYAISPAIKGERKIGIVDIAAMAGGFVGATVCSKIISNDAASALFSRWAKGFYAVLLIVILCFIMEKISLRRYYVLDFLGKYTLELYLLHVTLRAVFNKVGLPTANIGWYAIVVAASLLIAPLLAMLTDRINGLIFAKNAKPAIKG